MLCAEVMRPNGEEDSTDGKEQWELMEEDELQLGAKVAVQVSGRREVFCVVICEEPSSNIIMHVPPCGYH